MWPSKCCQQWWSPKCCSPYSRCYKYTYCLSGTAKCFYALTEQYVHVPFIAGWMCQNTLELTPQSACTEYAWRRGGHVLCGYRICVFFVSDEWAIFWCPVTRSMVHITGRFPTMWRTIETHLLCCWGTQNLTMTWTSNSKAMCHT